MKINLLDLLHHDVPQKYEDLVAKAYDLFWDMADYSSHYCIDFNNFMHRGIPQEVTLEIQKGLLGAFDNSKGCYYEYESHIVIRDQGRAQKRMLNTIEHELAHLFLVESLGINPEHNDHPVDFWEFLKRFRRYRRKALRERQ